MNNEGMKEAIDKHDNKKVDEFIGLCKGLLADDRIVEPEVRFLQSWLEDHQDISKLYPISAIYQRIIEILEDDIVDEDEEEELLITLKCITAKRKQRSRRAKNEMPAFDTGKISFENKFFTLTGRFIIGTHCKIAEFIKEKGGTLQDEPDEETDYMVVGNTDDPDWTASSSFECINQAISMLKVNPSIKFINEENWLKHIF